MTPKFQPQNRRKAKKKYKLEKKEELSTTLAKGKSFLLSTWNVTQIIQPSKPISIIKFTIFKLSHVSV
jgi:hypothetical protein